MKAATLESKFPILSVEHDCIISKDADITVAYRVELPELFTVTQAEYEAIHSAWAKAVKVLQNYISYTSRTSLSRRITPHRFRRKTSVSSLVPLSDTSTSVHT